MSFVSTVKLEHKDDFQYYDFRKNLRLDLFLANFVQHKPDLNVLWSLLKIILILSHGQASVERGFSVNKDLLTSNMSKRTIVAHRLVTDAIRTKLGAGAVHMVYNIGINQKMMTNCRAARMRYSKYSEDESKNKVRSEATKIKVYLQEQISETKSKKRKLENTAARLLQEADELAEKAEQRHDFSLIRESNTLRDKAKRVRKDINKEVENIKTFEIKLKKVND